MDNFFKKGFRIAGLLHALLFSALFLTFLVNHFVHRKPPQHVFQLEEIAVGNPVKVAIAQPKPIVPIKAPAVAIATLPVPKAPVPSIPPPAPSIKAKGVVIPKLEQQTKVSYNDFLKNQKTSNPKEVKAVAVQPVSVPKIQASDIKKNLEQKLSPTEASKTTNSSIIAGYQDYVRSIIDASWEQPQDFSGYGNGALFEFDIDKFGHICKVHIVKSSGSSIFDESIQKAFERVGSVRPTPDGKTLAGCRITFTKKSKVF